MQESVVVDLTREALVMAMQLSLPALAVGLVIALVCGVLQSVTQVQDGSLTAIPKILGVGAAVLFCLPWIVERLLAYSHDLLANAPRVIGGG